MKKELERLLYWKQLAKCRGVFIRELLWQAQIKKNLLKYAKAEIKRLK